MSKTNSDWAKLFNFEFKDDSILKKCKDLFLDSKIKHFYYINYKNRMYLDVSTQLSINKNILLFSSNYTIEKFLERNEEFVKDIDLMDSFESVKLRKMRDVSYIIRKYDNVILADNLILEKDSEKTNSDYNVKEFKYKVGLYEKKTEEESNIL